MTACGASENAGLCKAGVSGLLRRSWQVDPLSHRLSGMTLVLVGNDYMIVFCQTAELFGKIECSKSYVDRSSLHNSPVCEQSLIDQQRPGRHEQRIFVHAGN